MFTEKDKLQIAEHGLDIENTKKQVHRFEKGFPYLEIKSSATEDNGIFKPSEQEALRLVKVYDEAKEEEILKFVPASGAATRMFKHLYAFLNDGEITDDVESFIKNIKKFAFYNELNNSLAEKNKNIDQLIIDNDYKTIIEEVLGEEGLNYGFLPKGLISFHSYGDAVRTAFEEHLVEAAKYASGNNKAKLHFTVSKEHLQAFKEKFDETKYYYQNKFNLQYYIEYSTQNPSTDTIAVTPDNKPFRNQDGTLLFRPGGHGSLLQNLNSLEADIIFIKNIDNIVPDKLAPQTVFHKKLLAGKLLEIRTEIFKYQQKCDSGKIINYMPDIEEFYKNELFFVFPKDYADMNLEKRADYIQKLLFRPIRICGMVRNDGDTGGGPFITKNQDGSYSLQIVESAQFNENDKDQQQLIKQATHFNPNDIACSIRNYKGEKYVLEEYKDPDTGFISKKSKDGADLKALEHPGLWNGSMSNWNTLFVDVPLITFNPVKSVNDLLEDNHQ